MSVRQQQMKYGFAIGLGVFLCGTVLTHLLLPGSTLSEFARWKVTIWTYLSAHFVSISAMRFGGISYAYTEVDLINAFPALQSLRAVPILLVTLGSVLVVDSVDYTSRFKYILQNSASVLLGYLSAAIVAFVLSGAQRGTAMYLMLVALAAAGLFIGSRVVGGLTGGLPIFGIASLGGIVLIGIFTIFGGLMVIRSIGPLFLVAASGAFAGAVLSWLVRNTR